jgi:chloramphenicol-sensitive protein RarD
MSGSGGVPPAPTEARTALAAGISCYLIWGFAPLAFQQMGAVGADPLEVMAHRAIWGVVWAGLLVLMAHQSAQVRAILSDRRTLGWLALSTALIAVNWTIFVLAVTSGRLLDASLGYYLNPLLSMAAGSWFFSERLDRWGLTAIALAAVGVVLQALALGHLPWISLVLALSFAAYGVIRKRVSADAQAGLFVECLLLAPLGLGWAIWLQVQGTGHFTDSAASVFWLMAAGPITVLPLALFAWAARRMPLSTMGFLQFMAPSIAFIIGTIQGEPLGDLRVVSFAFIWVGALVYAAGAVRRTRAVRVLAPEPGLIDPPAERP